MVLPQNNQAQNTWAQITQRNEILTKIWIFEFS